MKRFILNESDMSSDATERVLTIDQRRTGEFCLWVTHSMVLELLCQHHYRRDGFDVRSQRMNAV